MNDDNINEKIDIIDVQQKIYPILLLIFCVLQYSWPIVEINVSILAKIYSH